MVISCVQRMLMVRTVLFVDDRVQILFDSRGVTIAFRQGEVADWCWEGKDTSDKNSQCGEEVDASEHGWCLEEMKSRRDQLEVQV